jgi:hypothetical protein
MEVHLCCFLPASPPSNPPILLPLPDEVVSISGAGTMPYTWFCPGFSECLVFSAGMNLKIAIDKNLENTIWQCFEGFLTRFYEPYA